MQKQTLKILLTSLLGLAIIVPNALASYEISDGSVKADYHFNGDSTDSSGAGHNGTDTNTAYSTSTAKFGQALYCNGSAQVSVPNSATLVPGNGTYAFWVNKGGNGQIWRYQYTSGSPYGGFIFNSSDGTPAGNMYVQYMAGTGTTYPTDWTYYTSSYAVATSSWHFWVHTIDGARIKTWLDGALIDNNAWAHAPANPTSGSMYFCSAGSSQYFTGYIDEAVISSSVWSTSTIQSIYNNGSGQEICTTAGCAGGGSSTTTLSTSTDCNIGTDSVDWTLIQKAVEYIFYLLLSVLILSLAIVFLFGFFKRRK